MHLIKCHFHEFLSKFKCEGSKKWRKSWSSAGEQFSENSISFYYLMQLMPITHFNYSGFYGRGSKGERGRARARGPSSTAELKSSRKQFTEHDECILLRITISTLAFCCFSVFISITRFAKTKIWFLRDLECLERKKLARRGSSNERRGKIAREWNNQHNRSF